MFAPLWGASSSDTILSIFYIGTQIIQYNRFTEMVYNGFNIIRWSLSIRAWLRVWGHPHLHGLLALLHRSVPRTSKPRWTTKSFLRIIHKNYYYEKKNHILYRDSNRGPKTQLNVALDPAATAAGPNFFSRFPVERGTLNRCWIQV